jgi:SIR2-like domain
VAKKAKKIGRPKSSNVIDWSKKLVSDIARRRCVLVLGAGISNQARTPTGAAPKTWSEFLNAALGEVTSRECKLLARELIGRRDYLTACEVIKDSIGSDFADFVRAEFLTPGYKPAPIHDTIMKLDSRLVLTPNFDKLYETHVSHSSGTGVVVKSYHEDDVAEVIRGADRCILKVHGSIDSPAHMIFTRSEYANARQQYGAFYLILQALVLTHTFLFIGCGLDDPDTRLLLEDYAFRYKYSRPHFLLFQRAAWSIRIVRLSKKA